MNHEVLTSSFKRTKKLTSKNLKQLFTALSLLVLPMISNAQNIITIAGNGNIGYGGDGYPATSGYCEMWEPTGICMDKLGNIYISDNSNNVIRKINTDGIISTFAGIRIEGYGGYSGDGGPATNAELNVPEELYSDSVGNLYIADYDNAVIRMINSSGIISTIIGTGRRGYGGDGGPSTAAEMDLPFGICADSHGNMYVSEYGGNRIRIINSSGIINTLAGNGVAAYSGDGGAATAAEVWAPLGICSDLGDNIYISEGGGNVIRKITTDGIISTIAGTGTRGYSGDGGLASSAELNFPTGLCFDASGNLLITDGGNLLVREINTSGIITTIAGNGTRGYSGDGGPATAAEFNSPYGICLNMNGNVCITDVLNDVAREIVYNTADIENIIDNESITVYPNPVSKVLTINFNRFYSGLTTLSIMDITGREVLTCVKNINTDIVQDDLSSLAPAMYFIQINNKDIHLSQKFIKQ